MSSLSFKNPISENAAVKPVKLRLGVASYDTPTWAKVLEMTARAMLDSVRTRKAALDAVKRFSWMAHSSSGMARPCKLEKNLWIELHQGSHGILVRTKMLLEACGYPLDQASLECSESTDKSAKSGKDAPSAPPPSAVVTPSKPPTSHPQSKSIFPAKATLAEPVQPTLFGPSSPEQPSLIAASRDTGKSHRGKAKEPYTAYPKRELFSALAEDRIPDEDFNGLLTLAGTRALLGMTPRHNTPVFSLSPQRFFWRDAAARRGQSVFVTAQWFERDKARLDKLLSRWKDQPKNPPKTPDMKRFLDDIREHWPDGFDFSDGAVRLLENRCGLLSRSAKKALKTTMFHPRGKLWFVPDAVVPTEAQNEVVENARRLVGTWGFASLPLLATLIPISL